MKEKMVSVIMSIYNEDWEYIKQAVISMTKQTYDCIEIIIVIDNPQRQDIAEKISELKDNRIKVYINEKNMGLATSMNIAASRAQGEYIARMDADDISAPDRIEKQMQYIEENKINICSTYYHLIDETGNSLDRKVKKYNEEFVNRVINYFSPICHPTVIMTKQLFNEMRGYNNYPCSQDYDLWLRIKKQGYIFGYLEDDLYSYRVRQNSITSRMNYKQIYTAIYQKKCNKKNVQFEEKNYQEYISRSGLNCQKEIDLYKFSCKYQQYAKEYLKQKKMCRAIINMFKAFVNSKIYRTVMIFEIKKAILCKVK